MTSYLSHLQDVYSPLTFSRKLAYIQHNIGPFFPKKKNAAILEIGPGMGEFIAYANSLQVKNIDVTDLDEGVLKYVRDQFQIRRSFQTGSLAPIEKKLGTYDLVVMIQVLEHIPPAEYSSTIQTLYTHLSPGGHIVIVVPNGNNPLGMVERYGDLQHFNSFTTQSLKDLVALGSLKNAEIIIRGYRIPPFSIINIVRILVQKIVHAFLLLLLIGNGGTYFTPLDPNIMLVLKKGR
jgi:2-polyprenyl-3-methyl-5-hydroxy-6-metoxy-1,4-benzoquinol methylase